MIDYTALARYEPLAGYIVTDSGKGVPNSLADGSFNVFIQGVNDQVIFQGLTADGTGGRSMFVVAGGHAALVDSSVTAYGSVFNYISNSLFWIGEGNLYRNGVVMEDSITFNDFVATSNLQLSPSPYHHAYTAGLAQPDAPQVEAHSIDDTDSLIGLLTGLFFQIARRTIRGFR
jgi:hypothetical protein